jgi:hypothetical protein
MLLLLYAHYCYRTLLPYFANKSDVWGAWGVDVTKNG